MPIITWICEECRQQKEGGLRPPQNWVELSYWHPSKAKFMRYSFCSYRCCSLWAGERYDEPEINHAKT